MMNFRSKTIALIVVFALILTATLSVGMGTNIVKAVNTPALNATTLATLDPLYYEIAPKPVSNRNPLIATTCVKLSYSGTHTKSKNLIEINRLIDKTALGVHTTENRYPDIIILTEALYTRWLASPQETIPGPYSNALALKCKEYNTYICFNMLELCPDGIVRNAEVLLDRDGLIVGKYYKIKIPAEEAGYTTAGTEYKVFQTEFGNLGMMVCYDLDASFNGVVAKGLKDNGAEIVLASSIGDYVLEAKIAATQNHMAMAISGQEKYRTDSTEPVSSIYNSDGVRLAGVTDRTAPYTGDNQYRPEDAGSFAYAYVDLGTLATQTPVPTATPAPTPTATPAPTVTPTPTPLLGDVNGDGKVSPSDALIILQSVSGKIVLTDLQKVAADVTKDGFVRATDALKILQYCSGKITEL